jgi:hypothetical protein
MLNKEIQYSIRQLRFKPSDNYNPVNLKFIAEHFKVGNARACMFALFYVYGLEGHEIPKNKIEKTTEAHNLSLFFKPQQLTKAEALAASYGISLLELCKRAILEVANLIRRDEIKGYEPRVLKFFQND